MHNAKVGTHLEGEGSAGISGSPLSVSGTVKHGYIPTSCGDMDGWNRGAGLTLNIGVGGLLFFGVSGGATNIDPSQ